MEDSMKLADFFGRVEAHAELEGVGVDAPEAEEPGAVVQHTPSGLTTRLPLAAVEQTPWEVLEEVLVGRREPEVLRHMTRVVGYYSRIQNWNKSKIGELKGRHQGRYELCETQ
jgi:hypothetical protein